MGFTPLRAADSFLEVVSQTLTCSPPGLWFRGHPSLEQPNSSPVLHPSLSLSHLEDAQIAYKSDSSPQNSRCRAELVQVSRVRVPRRGLGSSDFCDCREAQGREEVTGSQKQRRAAREASSGSFFAHMEKGWRFYHFLWGKGPKLQVLLTLASRFSRNSYRLFRGVSGSEGGCRFWLKLWWEGLSPWGPNLAVHLTNSTG